MQTNIRQKLHQCIDTIEEKKQRPFTLYLHLKWILTYKEKG